jgi:import inner membrane translocase subunit TIM16
MALGKLFAKVIGIGLQMLTRAVMDAYKQAVKNAISNPNNSNVISRQAEMTLAEASKILNVDPQTPIPDVISKYKHLFEMNSKTKSGSFYLQSKVVRARERFQLERPNEPWDELLQEQQTDANKK